MSKPVLTYFSGRGRGETLRLMMAATNVEWAVGGPMTEPDHIDKLRATGKLMFNQLPLLEWNGMNLVQSMACIRYIAEKGGLYGKTAEEKARIDMVTDGVRDLLSPFLGYKFMPDDQFMKGIKGTVDKFMPFFEKILSAGQSQFLCGYSLSMADVCLLEVTLMVEELIPAEFAKYPAVEKHFRMMKSLPNIAAYLSSDKRSPPNTDKYIAEVKRTLKF